MDRIQDPTATDDNQFQEAGTGSVATRLRALWLNGIQEELIHILEEAGITPSSATLTQVLQALKIIFPTKALLSASDGSDYIGYGSGTLTEALVGIASDISTLEGEISSGLTGGAPVYADTTAGLAATSEGEYFNVPSAEDAELLILYLHDAGPVATEIGRSPSALIAERIPEIAPIGYAWAVLDEDGKAAMGVKDDGTVEATLLEVEELSAGFGSLGEGTDNGFAFSVLDQNGRGGGIKNDGSLSFSHAEISHLEGVRTINGESITDSVSLTREPWGRTSGYTAELNGVLSYGQSLSVGSTATPVISTTQAANTVMFSGLGS